MRARTLGRSGLSLTELGFGGGAIGGLYAPVGRDAAMAAMEAAWDEGMRYFDTAPFYGHGLSERRVGDFLRGRDGWVLSTKVGKLLRPVPSGEVPDHGFVDPLPFRVDFDYSHDAILRSVEDSLQRLGLSRIDLLYVHDLERGALGAAYEGHLQRFLGGGARALDRLKIEGVIKGWGPGSNEVPAILALLGKVEMDVLLLAGRYTLLDRRAEAELLPLCERHGVGVVIGGVFNSGILATGAVPGANFDYALASEDILGRVRAMSQVAAGQGLTLPAAALRFALAHPAVASVLIGSAKPSSLRRAASLVHEGTCNPDWDKFRPLAMT